MRSATMGILVAAGLAIGAAPAAAAVSVSSFDNGWYAATGSHSPSNDNIWTGNEGPSDSDTTNHFLAFDLSSLVGQTVVGATLVYVAGNGRYASSDPSETVGWYDFLGSIDALLAGTGGVAAHGDLGGGTAYGSTDVSGTPVAFGFGGSGAPMPEVSGSLNAAALAAINAVLGGADQRFVIGATIETASSGDTAQQKLWWGSSGTPAADLILELAGDGERDVPAPASLPLLGVGLAAFAALRRRRT